MEVMVCRIFQYGSTIFVKKNNIRGRYIISIRMCHVYPHSCTNTNTKSFILSRSYINNNISSNELYTDIMLIFGKLSPLEVKLLFYNTQVGIHMWTNHSKGGI